MVVGIVVLVRYKKTIDKGCFFYYNKHILPEIKKSGGAPKELHLNFKGEKMELIETITKAIEPTLMDMGYELVRVAINGAETKTVQIMAERKDRQDMTLDDCEEISHTASALLDVADPFDGRWVLEVSSPGIDRPLVKPADYDRFKGEEAKIELLKDIDGRKRFKGLLKGIQGSEITMDFEGQEIKFDFADVAKAKLTFKDETLDNKKGKK